MNGHRLPRERRVMRDHAPQLHDALRRSAPTFETFGDPSLCERLERGLASEPIALLPLVVFALVVLVVLALAGLPVLFHYATGL